MHEGLRPAPEAGGQQCLGLLVVLGAYAKLRLGTRGRSTSLLREQEELARLVCLGVPGDLNVESGSLLVRKTGYPAGAEPGDEPGRGGTSAVQVHGQVELFGAHPFEERLEFLFIFPSIEARGAGIGEEAIYVG
jgi:hypothetical protein